MLKSKTTIHDIAKALKISSSTVSRALRDNPRISKKTITAVKEIAKEMNYQPNGLATALRVGRSKMLGVVIPTANRYFFGCVLKGIEKVAAENGYTVVITQSNDDETMEKNNIESLLRAHVDGIIISVSKTSREFSHFDLVKNNGLPLILFDRVYEAIDTSTVTIDDYSVSYQATSHLIDQGYKRILHCSGPEYINIYKNRKRGYLDAMRDNGLSLSSHYIKEYTHLRKKEGRMLMEEILADGLQVDAIFAASDYSALGAMQVCKERGIDIPKDIGFVGFANEPFTEIIDPGLTTIDQKPEEMGMVAAQLFFQEMANRDQYINRSTILKPELIVRESSNRKKLNN